MFTIPVNAATSVKPLIPESYSLVLDQLVLPVAYLVVVLVLLSSMIGWYITKKPFGFFAGFAFTFTLVGAVSGLIAGSSAEPLAGTLLTGLLGIVTGLLSYQFGKDSMKEFRSIFVMSIAVLAIGAFAGLMIGRTYRLDIDNSQRRYAEWLMLQEQVKLPAAAKRKLYQDCLDLVDDSKSKCEGILTGK